MPTPLDSTWKECLALINQEVAPRSFKTWFTPVNPVSLDRDDAGAELILSVPSRFFGEWIESNYAQVLREAANRVVGKDTRIFFRYDGSAPEPANVSVSDLRAESGPRTTSRPPVHRAAGQNARGSAERAAEPIDPQVRQDYTFETFIEGDCNRFARSAALAIAESPGGTSFNPFLIYGGVGLGKTHLVQAVINHARTIGKAARSLYISSEQFIAQFVQAIQKNSVADFSAFYRNIDLLVVDDVQFLGGKEKTQEEFFHVFNSLHQAGKQIILCADRPPASIPGIEERLLSRFQWGLTADVQPADLETRCAILQRKAAHHHVDVDSDVVVYIAQHVTSNIRALEGALTRLVAASQIENSAISLQCARQYLSDLVESEPRALTIDQIQEVVATRLGVPVAQLSSRTRTRDVVTARHAAMYFAKERTTLSLKSIGLRFGGRDHSTVIHACNAVNDRLDVDPEFSTVIDDIRSTLDRTARQ
jgi:chromosomal replication initiator protein